MTSEEFQRLAHTYGGVVARWPADQRPSAEVFCAAHAERSRMMLAEAEALDLALDAWLPLSVAQDLRERVLGSAQSRRKHAPRLGWFWPAGIGVGLAAACAAGLVVGVGLSGVASGVATTDEPVTAVMTGYELPAPSETLSATT